MERTDQPAGQPSPHTEPRVSTPWQLPWPDDCIARYWTIAGATVDLTHANRTTPTDDGIGETRNHTLAACTGCPAIKEFSHWRVVKRMTFDDRVRDPEAADNDAHEWAQAHAEKCRALPRPAAQ